MRKSLTLPTCTLSWYLTLSHLHRTKIESKIEAAKPIIPKVRPILLIVKRRFYLRAIMILTSFRGLIVITSLSNSLRARHLFSIGVGSIDTIHETDFSSCMMSLTVIKHIPVFV